MSTILTDDEIATLMPNDDTPMSLGEAFYTQARAVEAAVLAKLAQQADRQRVPDEDSPAVCDAYERIDRFLRNNLGDEDYADYSHDLDLLAAAPEAPAQASESDERDRKDAERYRWLREQMLGVDFDWDESGKTALCFEMPDGCSFAADCDQVIDDASAALAQKGGAA